MSHEATTATKDPWAALSARLEGYSIGVVVKAEPGLSVVTPPAFPGLSLAVPAGVSRKIDALTRSSLDGAGLVDLPNFEDLATETTFGPDAGRLSRAGLSPPVAASVARWGSALYHFGSHLADARTAAQWASGKHQRAVDRRKKVDAANSLFVRSRSGQWGGAGVHQQWRDDVATRADIAPPERDTDAMQARLRVYQLEGRLRYLLCTGGLPCRMAVALAASFDGAGWSETACMLAGEMTPLNAKVAECKRNTGWIASVAHDAVRWAELTWRTAERPPGALRLSSS
jgi:hypothetical protein